MHPETGELRWQHLGKRIAHITISKGSDGEPQLPEAFRQYADMIVLPDGKLKKIDAGQYDHFYRNDGPGKGFKEITSEVGMSGNYYGLSGGWFLEKV